MQSKYLSNQINRPVENRGYYEQKISPTYQKKTINYAPIINTSYRSSNLGSYNEEMKPGSYDTFENIVSKHSKPKVVRQSNRKSSGINLIGKKGSNKKGMKDANDPNTIEFSNENGPETFTITHKT